ncbi:MAG: DNA polymerase sliding clamp [Methanoregula sp.]|nr:DNA polymerase sliding clamp [Methanoregula sp.]
MITPEGWNTLVVDTANVAMTLANMPKGQFEEFAGEEKTEIGMDMAKWKNVLDVMKDPKCTITIECPKDSGKIHITDGKYAYKIALLDVNTVRKRPTQPNISLPAAIVIDAKEFHDTIKALGVIGDKAHFTTCKEGLTLETEGDTDNLRKVLAAMDGSKIPEAPISSIFSLDYLRDISKAMKEAGTITVHLGQDHPVRVDFEIDGIEASFLVAPRISEDGQ